MPETIPTSIEDEVAAQAIAEYEAGADFKKARVKRWQTIEDLYFIQDRPILKGRINVPLPLMSAFIHTLESEINTPPLLKFAPTEEADVNKVNKVNAAWRFDSSSSCGKWSKVDRGVKKLAIMSGVGFYKEFAERVDGKYVNHFEWCDHYDMILDPTGGNELENHSFVGQDGIFKNKWELLEGAKAGIYNSPNVRNLVMYFSAPDSARAGDKRFDEKKNRYSALNLDTEQLKFVMPGQAKYKFVEFGTTYKGERWYVLFNYESKKWIRCNPLKENFKSELWPWVMWQVYEDPALSWTLSPAEEMIPVIEAMQMLFNQALENRQKKNWGQRAYDPDIFTDPSQLPYRQDGLVIAQAKGKDIRSGIFEFSTPEITGTIDLMSFLDGLSGQKTGVNSSTQGATEKDKKVGIYFGDMRQIAKRFSLVNDSYSQAYSELGLRYINGLRENMSKKMMVKIIGEKGATWEELTKEDLKPARDNEEFDIIVTAANADAEKDMMKQKMKADFLARHSGQNNDGTLSKKWVTEQDALNAGFTDEEVRVAMDTENEGNREILAEAAEENQKMFLGKEVEPNRGATSGHLQKHLDFIYDTEDIDIDVEERITKHFMAEVKIAQDNMARKASSYLAANPAAAPAMAGNQNKFALPAPAAPVAPALI